MKKILALSMVSWVVACTERSSATAGEPGGTLVISALADPGTLFPPFAVTNEAKQITEQIFDYLADVGPELNTLDEKAFRPGLADRRSSHERLR